MKKATLGLIGLGTIGSVHLHNCLRLKNAQLLSVADISKKSLNLAKKAGVKNTQRDYNRLLKNPDIDAVIISLPNHLHHQCARRAAEEGKHILIEKPLARNVKEGKQILSYTKRGGVKLMVGYPLRFSDPFTRLKNELQQGTLGDIQVAVATNISTGPFLQRTEESTPLPVPSWWFDKELTGGGALLDLGSHMINLLSWYFGDIASVKSYLGHRFNMDFEDHATCLLKFKEGPLATVNVGWFSQETQTKVELYGTARHAFGGQAASPSLLHIAWNALKRKTRGETSPFYKELQHFVDCLNSNTEPTTSGEEGLTDLKIIARAYEHTIQLDS